MNIAILRNIRSDLKLKLEVSFLKMLYSRDSKKVFKKFQLARIVSSTVGVGNVDVCKIDVLLYHLSGGSVGVGVSCFFIMQLC